MSKVGNKSYAVTFKEMAEMLGLIDFRHPGGSEGKPLIRYKDVDIYFRLTHSVSVLYPLGGLSVDSTIEENRNFSYPVFVPAGAAVKNKKALILLHGLNERRWEKYLPWAYNLCISTGRTVVLFPIAYHVNRAPGIWSSVRGMMPVMNLRKNASAHNTAVSFANAALSQRIDEKPERFIAGALQTINDVELLVSKIRADRDPLLDENASIHFFSYSIGCSLAEILLMLDEDREEPDKLFQDSRLCLFCGGSVLEYANPVSRAILDADAFSHLDQFFDEFGELPEKGKLFSVLSSLMKTRFLPELRNRYLLSLKNRVKGFMLSTDSVFPVGGLRRTWEDTRGNQLIAVNEYPGSPGSSHEVPFPVFRTDYENKGVQEVFLQIFSDAEKFLESPVNDR